jgi:hypothetical protein
MHLVVLGIAVAHAVAEAVVHAVVAVVHPDLPRGGGGGAAVSGCTPPARPYKSATQNRFTV